MCVFGVCHIQQVIVFVKKKKNKGQVKQEKQKKKETTDKLQGPTQHKNTLHVP